jgi:cation:H+ antiporter
MDYAWLIAGLALVALGAEFLVRGAVGLAGRLGVSPLLVGLTVVAWGTSTPELVVSVNAALAGSTGIAVGNVIGSNIFNILAIVGLAALLMPIPSPRREAIVRDGIVGLAAAVALFVFTRGDAEVGTQLGLGLLAALVIYSLFVFVQERLHLARSARVAVAEQAEERHPMSVGTGAMSVGAGLGALIFGATLLVDSGVAIARSWGVSETVIGLTLIAGGTSLPELATSAAAALKRQGDIAIGNVLGSNIYNILAILGATALIKPLPVPERIIAFDLPVLIAVSLFLLALLLFERRVGRWAGLVLFAAFVLYIYATYRGWA